MTGQDVELFAGAGGFSEAARQLGLDPLGIEWDDAACATRAARGHRTLQADVAALDPREFAPVRLMIAAPPCQAFSMAGNGLGRAAISVYADAIDRMMEGKPPSRAELDDACEDERAHLVLEVLRWALAVRPRFIACEQVKEVLPLWEKIGWALRSGGYRTWAGILHAERYGVPQTRKRAFLMASLEGQPSEPPATHARYVAPREKPRQEESLFEAPEPERIVLPEDRGLLPWISMAQALGWGMTARPFLTLASGRETAGPDKEKVGGSGAREVLYAEQEAGRWEVLSTFGEPGDRGDGSRKEAWDAAERPSQVVDTKVVGHWQVRLRANAQENAAVRSADEPAPTITAAHDSGERVWVHERPATTVAGDPRVFPPGHKLNDEDLRAGRGGQLRGGSGRVVQHRRGGDRLEEEWSADRPSDAITSRVDRWQVSEPDGDGAVRVSIEEASVLQGFPPDYPWQGSRTAIYRQIGDAVPPPLGRAVLAQLLGLSVPEDEPRVVAQRVS